MKRVYRPVKAAELALGARLAAPVRGEVVGLARLTLADLVVTVNGTTVRGSADIVTVQLRTAAGVSSHTFLADTAVSVE